LFWMRAPSGAAMPATSRGRGLLLGSSRARRGRFISWSSACRGSVSRG
jgi:hypothetical protein